MTVSLALLIAGGVLIGAGCFLIMDRSIMRILAGFLLAGNGVNLLYLVASGRAGLAPIIGEPESAIADPLPQAMVLTAIVISLAVSAFLLALSYRSFQLDGHDEVSDDVEDDLVRSRAHQDLTSESFEDDDTGDDDTESGGLGPDEAEEPLAPSANARMRRRATMGDA